MSALTLGTRELAREPIPVLPLADGWKDVTIAECGEPLVSFEDLGIPSTSFYAGLHDFSPYNRNSISGSLDGVYVREELGNKLLKATDLLPSNYCVVGLDGFRPDDPQISLYNFFVNQLKDKYPDWNEQQIEEYTQNFVSKPSTDPSKPAPHKTGGSIDAWLLRLPEGYRRQDVTAEFIIKCGMWLPAGAAFDHGGETSAMRYYEENDGCGGQIFRENRRIFYWIMREAGCEFFPPEFWHINYGNQMAAKTSSETEAKYGAAQLSSLQWEIETRSKAQKTNKITTNIPLGEIIQP